MVDMVWPTETTMPLLTQASITCKEGRRDPRNNHLQSPLQFGGESDQGNVLQSFSVDFIQASDTVRWTSYVLFWMSTLLLQGNERAFDMNSQYGGTMQSSRSTRNVGKD